MLIDAEGTVDWAVIVTSSKVPWLQRLKCDPCVSSQKTCDQAFQLLGGCSGMRFCQKTSKHRDNARELSLSQ